MINWIKTIRFSKIVILSTLILVVIGCSPPGNKLAAIISDSQLETLYGGCGWFTIDYCVFGGGDCPGVGGCDPDSYYMGSNCVTCFAFLGTICEYGKSYFPDFTECSVTDPKCPLGALGFCSGPSECETGEGGGGYSGDYPGCGNHSQCNDL